MSDLTGLVGDLSPLDGLGVQVRHTMVPGLGNLTYAADELWEPIATLRALLSGARRGHGRAFMAGGYLNLIAAPDTTEDPSPSWIEVWDVSDPRDPTGVRTWNNAATRADDGGAAGTDGVHGAVCGVGRGRRRRREGGRAVGLRDVERVSGAGG